MDKSTAEILLASLLERAEGSVGQVFLTKHDIEALATIVRGDGGRAAATIVAPPGPSPLSTNALPTLPVLTIRSEDLPKDTILCVDFGTSFSKAFVSRASDSQGLELFDLPIGDGSTGSRLTTPSEMLIDGDRIYFGSYARRRLDDTQVPAERLIDSIKQFITLTADVATLGEAVMDEAQVQGHGFRQRDVLALYLAHLMALTERAMEQVGLPKDTRRRFTHPAWKSAAKDSNEAAMRRLMAEAVLLARAAPDDFVESVPVATAKALLTELKRSTQSIPVDLIADPVREATAAGAGALLSTRSGRREAYLILDIGAGTTDVAGFYCVHNANDDSYRVFEVMGAADARNAAGNMLDNALQKLILEKSGLSPESQEYRLAALAIRRQRRLRKEDLFRNGSVTVDLPTDEAVRVELSEFLAYPPVAKFNKTIAEMVAKSAAAMVPDSSRVLLVATGGGARLPLIEQLARDGVVHEGRHISLEIRDAMPDSVRQQYPDLVDPYPQIAVSLGGSLPDLPEQRASISQGLGDAKPRVLAPQYR